MIEDWRKFNREHYEKLDVFVRAQAVEMLRTKLPVEDLEQRIKAQPQDWLMGKVDQTCWMCNGEGKITFQEPLEVDPLKWEGFLFGNLPKPEQEYETCTDTCSACKGSGRAREMPLHHGWGTAVRNLLRTEGFGEKELGVDNLDDYYTALVEAAVMGPSYVLEEK